MKPLYSVFPKLLAVVAIVMAFRSFVLLEQGIRTMVAFRQLVGSSEELNKALAIDAYPLLSPALLWGLMAGAAWWAYLVLKPSYKHTSEK